MIKNPMIARTDPDCQTEIQPIHTVQALDWRELLSASPLNLTELLSQLELTYDDFILNFGGPLDSNPQDFPIRAPAPFIARIQKGDINDPLLRQILPLEKENDLMPGYTDDPLGEKDYNVAPGLIHKYRSRALLIVTQACAIHCRYCFRRHFPYEDNRPARQAWQQALDYLRKNTNINEIILSGGDPLAVSNKQLQWLTQQLAAIPHIKTLRIHSRLPIVLPQRIDSDFIAWLKAWSGHKVVVIHSNHANEIDSHVKRAINDITSTGATILNQAVMLKGVNDCPKTLVELSQRLFNCGVLPYYLHLLDAVNGAAHFSISDARAKRIMGEVAGLLPGYLVPKLVRELANKKSKTLILPTES
ncbi:MAG: EF-P beta-lysylation protein EpmB [Pseudomonadota bacterium]|nr:EF-P beta-lysylation protein EpmB [Pseudomonadota bacterium]